MKKFLKKMLSMLVLVYVALLIFAAFL